MSTTQPWQLSALELARHIAARDWSCTEVMDAHLARIHALNPRLNAIVHLLEDEARTAAKAADAALARGDAVGPLHGVPLTVKANIDMAGQATTWGVAPLAHALAPRDAPAVQRLRAAGAIPLRRTNLPDMALRIHTDSSLHGLTLNPWNPARTCGGSSGGEAVALATGMSALGLGTDVGGSLRNPASACGIASIRPSRGRVPDASVIPSEDRLFALQAMNVTGPMARRVADVRAALGLLSGADPRDPQSLDYAPAPKPAGRMRVALMAEPPGGRTAPEVVVHVRRAALALEAAGYEVVETAPPRFEEAVATWARLLIGDFGLVMPQMLPMMGADAQRFIAQAGAGVPAWETPLDLSALLMQRDGIARAWSLFMADTPLLLSPTWTQLPFELGFDVAHTAETVELMRPVVPANLLGLPSACVPAGRDEATGLPVGVLLTGPLGRDEWCLDAAEAVEAALGLATPIS